MAKGTGGLIDGSLSPVRFPDDEHSDVLLTFAEAKIASQYDHHLKFRPQLKMVLLQLIPDEVDELLKLLRDRKKK